MNAALKQIEEIIFMTHKFLWMTNENSGLINPLDGRLNPLVKENESPV